MIGIKDFWRIDTLIKERYGKKWYNYIDYCGLIPIIPPERFDYFCTPKNSVTFATTGGDGVHFGFIKDDKTDIYDGIIVMTVPMTDKNNIIVAENFEEFLCLGYHVGWSALEELSYEYEDTIEYYSKPDPKISREEQLFLEILKEELKIKFVSLSKDRLLELHNKYFHKLEIAEFTEFNYEVLKPEHRKIVKDFFDKNEKNKNIG